MGRVVGGGMAEYKKEVSRDVHRLRFVVAVDGAKFIE